MKNKELIKLVKTARLEKKISQKKLSKLLNYSSAQFISNFERGLCPLPLKKLRKICILLSIPIEEMKIALITEYCDKIGAAFK